MDFNKSLIDAKYHFVVAGRLLKNYAEFEDKRFLIGVINELASSASSLIRAFLIRDDIVGKDSERNIEIFLKRVGPRYVDNLTLENIMKSLEIEKAQKESPVEFNRGGEIILLIEGNYKILKVNRLEEFLKSVGKAIDDFS